jgi:hypothetical protein
MRTVLRTGVEQLFNQLMRPKLRTLVSDMYKNVSYVLDNDSEIEIGIEYYSVCLSCDKNMCGESSDIAILKSVHYI